MAIQRTIVATLLFFCLGGVTVSAAQTTLQLATYTVAYNNGWPKVIEEFNVVYPDIKIEVQQYPNGVNFSTYGDKVLTMVAGGAAPDIVQTLALQRPDWINMNIVRDITSLWEKSEILKTVRFYPIMLDAAKHNGRYYGVPHDYNAMLYYANKDYLSETGMTVPGSNWTVVDLQEMAIKLTNAEKKVYGVYYYAGDSYVNRQDMYNWTGNDWLSNDLTEVMVDSPGNIAMLSYWNNIQNNLKASQAWPGAWKARGDYYTGGYALWQGWVTSVNSMRTQFTYDWNWTLWPKGPVDQKDFAQGHMYSITQASKNADAAWKFLEWTVSYEGQKAQAKYLSRQPMGPYLELWRDFFGQLPTDKAAYAMNFITENLYGPNNARTTYFWSSYMQMANIMSMHLNNIFTKGNSPTIEMSYAAEEIRGLLGAQKK